MATVRQQTQIAIRNITAQLNRKITRANNILYDSLASEAPVQTGLTRANILFSRDFPLEGDYRDFDNFGVSAEAISEFYSVLTDGGNPPELIATQDPNISGIKVGTNTYFTNNVPWLRDLIRRNSFDINSAIDDAIDQANRELN